jgi:alanyl-tRNA synthetase
MTRTSKEIRSDFLRFFEERGHTFVPSSPLLPGGDPTLLFANAGMNQFKAIFLGQETRDYQRATNSQKCIRAGGKHNDLEDVGYDTYHHTFFEMLGNWSFGDYFKAEAIQWAWALLTDVWGLPKDRLHVTVFEGDESEGLEADTEAADLWREKTDIDPSRIHLGNKKDNFWEMGDTGPCGPCSEIHLDQTPDGTGGGLVNADDPRVIEIWNLVFMQYNRGADGSLKPLPARHVDTGMGFERICRALNHKNSNYATDLFIPIIEAIEALTDHRYGVASGLEDRFDSQDMDDKGDVACRVIADHARALTCAIADGIVPSNEGRGYVLRRILRRAARYGRQYLNIEGPFVVKLVEPVVDLMGDMFPEVRQRATYITETIRDEEESFGRTLDRGIELFQRQAESLDQAGLKELPGDVAFDLYATYGFPVDLTQLMASERGLGVDMDGYDQAMARHRELSASDSAFRAEEIPDLPATDDSSKYDRKPIDATVLGWVIDGTFAAEGTLSEGDEAGVVLDCTNFYGEQGGQVGDAGHLSWEGGRFAVRDSQVAAGCVLHRGVVEVGTLHARAEVRCEVGPSRFDTMRNHTATHLLNWALRKVLGDHVSQAGSVVSSERLRFDFSHNQALTPEQTAQVEREVNARVLADEHVEVAVMPLADARKISGVRAVFGEKYPDPVRVVAIGAGEGLMEAAQAGSVEFCGGTHLERTSQVGLLKIVSEESVAKGVRRITALTGWEAVRCVQGLAETVRHLSQTLRVPPEQIGERVQALQDEIKELRKARKAGPQAGAASFEPEVSIESEHGPVLIGRVAHADAQAMRKECDRQRQKGAGAMLIGGTDGKKVMLVAMVTDAMAQASQVKAGAWVRDVAPIVGGGGGGKDTMAQAGGKQPGKLSEALKAAGEWVRERL